ncbi:MAG: LysR family transcriptional regulator, partial [Christensenellaceae bacterium]
MTLRHLEIFAAVADHGTMSGAARALYIAQPTVSQAVAELESAYQVRLFERLSRRLYLTPEGQDMLGYA